MKKPIKTTYRKCQAKTMLTEGEKEALERMSSLTPFTESTLLEIALQRLLKEVEKPVAWEGVIRAYQESKMLDVGAVFAGVLLRAYRICAGSTSWLYHFRPAT